MRQKVTLPSPQRTTLKDLITYNKNGKKLNLKQIYDKFKQAHPDNLLNIRQLDYRIKNFNMVG